MTKEEAMEFLSYQDNYENGERDPEVDDDDGDVVYRMKIVENENVIAHSSDKWAFIGFPYTDAEPVDDTLGFYVCLEKATGKAFCESVPLGESILALL